KIGKAVSRAKTGAGRYLLSGFLVAPDGRRWTGLRQARYYLRKSDDGESCMADKDVLETAVVDQMIDDMQSDAFVKELLQMTKRAHEEQDDPTDELKAEIKRLTKENDRLSEMALEMDNPRALFRRIEANE